MDENLQLAAINDVRARLGRPPLASLNARDPRAVAKLSLVEQCEIWAYCACKVPKYITAVVFDVSLNTVLRIARTNPKIYPRVFAEVMSFNNNYEFCQAHITEKNEAAIIALYPQHVRPSQPKKEA